MKKILTIILIVLPITSFAIWWNPLTYFQAELQPTETKLGLATTSSYQTIIPFQDNAYDLGTTTRQWRNIFMYNSAAATRCLQITSTGLIQIASAACGSGGGGSGSGTWATTTITGSANYFNYPLNATDVVGIGSITGTSTSKFWFDPNLSRSFLSYASTTGFSSSYASSTVAKFGSLFVPPLTAAAGAFLAIDSSGQIIATTSPRTSAIVFDVRSYGADFTDASDDTTAIQAALNACAGVSGSIVEMPAGTGYYSTAITVPPECTLRGQGKQATLLRPTVLGGVLPGGAAITTAASSDYIILQGFELLGNNDSATSGKGIYMPTGVHSFIVIRDVYVHQFPESGIHLVDPILCSIEDSWLRDNGLDGMFIDIGTTCNIKTVYASGNNRAGFHLKTHTSTAIINTASEYNTYGYWLESSGNITLDSPYVEVTMRADGGTQGLAAAYRVQSSQNVVINDGYSNSFAYLSGVPAYHIYVTGSQRISLNNFRGKALASAETGLGEAPTSTLFIDSTSGVALNNTNFTDLGSLTPTNGIVGIPQSNLNGDGNLALGTSTPYWQIESASSTASQLALSNALGNVFAFRVTGTSLSIGTSSVLTAATNTPSQLSIASSGFGTTTLRGLNISGLATSTSNVGFNITAGCYAISGTCLSAGAGGSGDITSVGDVSSGAAFDGTQGTLLTFFNGGGNGSLGYNGANFAFSHGVNIASTTPFATLAVNPTAGLFSNQFVIGSSTATNFIVDNSGTVGIGTSTPAKGFGLAVNGTSYFTNTMTQFSATNAQITQSRNAVTNSALNVYQTAGVDQWSFGLRNDAAVSNVNNIFHIRDSVNSVDALAAIQGTSPLIGIGTSTPQWKLNPFSNSASQLSLSNGAGSMQWAFRNAGDTLYLSTTTVSGLSTSTQSALEIAGNGFGTTTVRGLNISAQATSTANTGFNITTGCYSINGTCIGNVAAGAGLTSYDAWTHPNVGESATTSLIKLFGQASSTLFSSNRAWFGQSATTSINDYGLLSGPYSSSTIYSSFVTASSTFYLGANLQTCNSTTGKLTWASGVFGCGTDFNTGTDPFTHTVVSTSATSTEMRLDGGLISTASTTLNASVFLPALTQGFLYTGTGGILKTVASSSAGFLQSYDAWTHPSVGQSATTSLMKLFGQASSTLFSSNFAQFGATATTTFTLDGKLGVGSTTPAARLSINSVAGDPFSFWVGSTTAPWLQVSNSGFGTTTISGLNIAGSATSTSNVGYNITTGCYAISGTCLSASGGSGDITSVGDVASGAAFDGTQGTTLTFNNAGGDKTIDYDGTDFNFGEQIDIPSNRGYKIGGNVMFYATSTTRNTLGGFEAGTLLVATTTGFTSANWNTVLGYQALAAATSTSQATAIGAWALQNATAGYDPNGSHSGWNTAVGYAAGRNVTYGFENAFFGRSAGLGVVTGGENTALGNNSMDFVGGASQYNTAVGWAALGGKDTGDLTGNTALGWLSGNFVSTGGYNTLLGYNVSGNGGVLNTGSYNILLGQSTDVPTLSTSGYLSIGNVLFGKNMYSGSSVSSSVNSTGAIGISTSTPNYGLTVASTTGPQFSLSAGAGLNQWVMRNEGGELAFATSTYLATSTKSALRINANGQLQSSNLIGCDTIDTSATGVLTCGTDTGGSSYDAWTHPFVGSSATTTQMMIGTSTAPSYRLTIASSTQPQLALSDSAGRPLWTMRNAGGNFYMATTSADGTSTSSPAFTINNSGNGVFLGGTTTNSSVTGVAISGTSFWTGLTSSSGLQTGILCLSATNEVINESVACVASDERAKNIEGDFAGALDEILQIQPILFHYKPEFNGKYESDPNFNSLQLGLGARALQQIDPKLVTVYSESGYNGLFEFKKGEASGLKESALITLALTGIKELNDKIGATTKLKENIQWILISLLILGMSHQQMQIRKLKK